MPVYISCIRPILGIAEYTCVSCCRQMSFFLVMSHKRNECASIAHSPRLEALIEVPFDPLHATITLAISDGIEKLFRAVDAAIDTAHALVLDSRNNFGVGGGVEESDGLTAEWIGVAQAAHHANWHRDGHLLKCVDGVAASTKTTVPVCHIADTSIASAFAIT